MSELLQGFVLPNALGKPGGGRFESVSDVEELGCDRLQKLLGSYHPLKIPMHCGCGLFEGKPHPLHIHKMPGSTELSLWCNDRLQHPPECWLCRAGDTRESGPVFRSSIFRIHDGMEATAQTVIARHSSDQVRSKQYRFGRFGAHMFSKAQIDAFAGVNSDWQRRGFRQPSAADILNAVDRQLRLPLFPAGSAYQSATKEGCTLGFGVIEWDIAHCTNHCGELVNVQWWRGGVLCGQPLLVPCDVWNESLGAVTVRNALQQAPYIFFATVDREGRVRQLRLFACFSDGRELTQSDSGGETAFSSRLGLLGCVRFKPLLRSDLSDLFNALGFFGNWGAPEIRYRPDFVVFFMHRGTWRCVIVELRGFKPGLIPAYDAHLAVKREYFNTLDPHIIFKERNAWDYERPPFSPSDVTWIGLDRDWLGESEAVKRWRRES